MVQHQGTKRKYYDKWTDKQANIKMKILNYLIVLLHVNAWVQFCSRKKLLSRKKIRVPEQ